MLGVLDGEPVGEVGVTVGCVGRRDGFNEGNSVGRWVGTPEGIILGVSVGRIVGKYEG